MLIQIETPNSFSHIEFNLSRSRWHWIFLQHLLSKMACCRRNSFENFTVFSSLKLWNKKDKLIMKLSWWFCLKKITSIESDLKATKVGFHSQLIKVQLTLVFMDTMEPCWPQSIKCYNLNEDQRLFANLQRLHLRRNVWKISYKVLNWSQTTLRNVLTQITFQCHSEYPSIYSNKVNISL